jgi:predicted AlkP superfamily pyrophosphatase or phosphodiesterase
MRANTPHIDELAKNGILTLRAQVLSELPAMTGNITESAPGWSSLFTGVWPNKHGVLENREWAGSNFKDYPGFLSRIETAEPARSTHAIVQWQQMYDNILGQSQVDTKRLASTDDDVERLALQMFEIENPDAVFLHFDDVDHAGHEYGYDSRVAGEYEEAIERIDRRIGDLLKALRRRWDYGNENWLIIVTTDHGGIGKGHGGDHADERTAFILVSGQRKGRPASKGEIVDIAPTALDHLEIKIERSWGLDGKPFK